MARIIDSIQKKVSWRVSDQDFVRHVAKYNDDKHYGTTDGGAWAITENMFNQTKTVEMLETYYDEIE